MSRKRRLRGMRPEPRPTDGRATADGFSRRQAGILAEPDQWFLAGGLVTDHLRALWEDPYLFARIAAVHALGDIWAMGATPQSALVQLTLPRLAAHLQESGLEEVMAAAEKIAEKSALTTMAVKEAVNRSYETTLREGLLFERRLFHSLFATEDQAEGMTAFLEKREAQFRHK